MKKAFRIVGIILLSLIGLLVVLFLLARFVFRDYISDLLNAQLQAQRVELLRTAGPYSSDTAADFQFTYTQDTVRAREIRDYFRLDTLLNASGPTWNNTLILAKFVARHIPHANQTIYPEQSNAIALWEYSRTVEPAFNCRLHAIMLHELLLASGITNRFVTCLPADSLDNDCHVVNIVWLPEQQKWAMIDSDMQAYVSDPAGTPLSLQEMRERYIANEPMTINRLLGKKNDAYYAAYWAKNLYWFICWEATGYDREPTPKGEVRSICLIPEGFEASKVRNPVLRTSNPEQFWAAPDTID